MCVKVTTDLPVGRGPNFGDPTTGGVRKHFVFGVSDSLYKFRYGVETTEDQVSRRVDVRVATHGYVHGSCDVCVVPHGVETSRSFACR